MRALLRSLALSALLLVISASAAHAQISFNVRIGTPPPPPRAYRVLPQPGPDFEWVEGYWYPQGKRYVWHDGYWTRPPYAGAYWVEPYYLNRYYYAGHWEGSRGKVDHDHRWDKRQEKDERREGRGRGDR